MSVPFVRAILSNTILSGHSLYPLYTHRHAVFQFLHLTFYSYNSNYIRLLFLLTLSLHKQPFITAHFPSSLHIIVHRCTLEQALVIFESDAMNKGLCKHAYLSFMPLLRSRFMFHNCTFGLSNSSEIVVSATISFCSFLFLITLRDFHSPNKLPYGLYASNGRPSYVRFDNFSVILCCSCGARWSHKLRYRRIIQMQTPTKQRSDADTSLINISSQSQSHAALDKRPKDGERQESRQQEVVYLVRLIGRDDRINGLRLHLFPSSIYI